MSNGLRTLLLHATLVAGIVSPSVAVAQTQQPPTKEAPPLPQPQFQTRDTRQSPLPDLQQMREAQQSQMRGRVAAALERVQSACREEIKNY